MDCRKGDIYHGTSEEIKSFAEKMGRPLAPVSDEQYKALSPLGSGRRKNYMRNQPCVCGSGKKFKKCCWGAYL